MVLGLRLTSRGKKDHPATPPQTQAVKASLSLPNLRTSLSLIDGADEDVSRLLWRGEAPTENGDGGYHADGEWGAGAGAVAVPTATAVSGDEVPVQPRTPTRHKTSLDGQSQSVRGTPGRRPSASSRAGASPPQSHRPFSPASTVESGPGAGYNYASLGAARGRVVDFRVGTQLRTEDLRGGERFATPGGVNGGGTASSPGSGVMNRSYPVLAAASGMSGVAGLSDARYSAASSPGRPSRRAGRSKKGKRLVLDLNVVVVGRKGVGKTSFANLLLNAPEHPDVASHLASMSIHLDDTSRPSVIAERHEAEADSAQDHSRGASQVTINGNNGNRHSPEASDDTRLFRQSTSGTKHFSSRSRTLVVSPGQTDPLSPIRANGDGGLSRSSSMIRSPHRNRASFASIRSMGLFGGTWREQRVGLNVIDTPGLAFQDGRELELERQLRGLMRISETRLAETLSEETQVSRRGLGTSDRLIHLVIYLIDPRTILSPPVPTAWQEHFPPVVGTAAAKQGVVFDFLPTSATTGSTRMSEQQQEGDTWFPHLRKQEVQVITRLANRSNVLPVVTRSDTLTLAQRQSIRTALRRDLATAGLKWGGFDALERRGRDSAVGDDESEASDGDDDGSEGSIQLGRGEEGTPSGEGSVLPFFLFSPEEASATADQLNGDAVPKAATTSGKPFTRSFPWCALDALNPAHSDFARLYSNLLGPLLMKLKDEARDTYYERYRTERLLARQAQAGRI